VIVLDVNVLVAAYLTGHAFHAAARTFLNEALEAGGVGVPDVVWSGFARTVTNPAVAQPPATWTDVRAFAEALQRHPGYDATVRSMRSSVDSFLALCQMANARRNKISDAHIAAIAIDHNASVATWDSDFDDFPVSVVRPPLPSCDEI